MLVVLVVGLSLIAKYRDHFHKCTLRKLFHILALVMFTPTLLKIIDSRKHQQFMVFAFNAVSVWLIMIEQARQYYKPNSLHAFFSSFCDERESKEDGPIVTHLYLLLGCGLPITISFIIFDGGFFNGEFTTLAFSGIIFLGVGDVAAALYGRAYGVQKWHKGTTKS